MYERQSNGTKENTITQSRTIAREARKDVFSL